jgi:XTP/dITP diphosphohydrolase
MSHDISFSAEGICEGVITKEEVGDQGFGYDSIFIPDGEEQTFAEMDSSRKNAMSHRAKAGIHLSTALSALLSGRHPHD